MNKKKESILEFGPLDFKYLTVHKCVQGVTQTTQNTKQRTKTLSLHKVSTIPSTTPFVCIILFHPYVAENLIC